MHNAQKGASARHMQLQNVVIYDFIKHLTDADLAWEFLRRNSEFQQEMREKRKQSLSIQT